MSGVGPTGPAWRVELSRDAAREVRQAPPVVRRALADLLDRLAASGLPAGVRSLGDRAYEIRSGPVRATVLVDPDERSILVAGMSPAPRPVAQEVLRAAHVPAGWSQRLGRLIDELWSDVRTSSRAIRRSPGFVLSVVATLAVAIGGATALFGLADTVFHAALPFEDGSELLRLRDRRVTASGEPRIFNMSPLDFATIRAQATSLEGVAAATGSNHVLTGGEAAQRVNVLHVSEGWASVLGIRPGLGRLFSEEEERLGRDAQVALLSHTLWETRFGADPGVIGRAVEYDGGTLTVVGVMRPRFRYPYDADLWIPWRWDPTDGTSHDLNVVARMGEGATLESARRDLDRIAAGLQESRPDTNADLFLNAQLLRRDFIREDDRVLVALMAAVGFLLMLACVNVANLFVARFISRRREVGIRVALGAGRVREVRGFVVETVLLFLLGGGVGVVLAAWLGDAVDVLVPDVMRDELAMGGVSVSPSLIAFAVVLSVVAGSVVGVLAALRGTGGRVIQVLRDGGRGSSSGSSRVQRWLVVTQLALSFALLAGAGVLSSHFRQLVADDLGMDLEGLYTLRVSLEQERFAAPEARTAVVDELTRALQAVPGVEAVGYSTVNPLCCGDWGAPLAVEGVEQPEGSTHLIHHRMVGSGYFAAAGIPLLRGRDFDDRERPGSAPTVIVDEALADRFWPGEDPLGKRVRIDRPGADGLTVVGVVGDVDEEGDYSETWYLPCTRDPVARSSENLHFMLRGTDVAVLQAAREAVRSVDTELAVYEQADMTSLRAGNISQDRLGAVLATGFAAFGLLLAALGVFGTLSYNVGTRSREIGTRIALGARPGEVTQLILSGALKLTLVGGVLGLTLAVALTRVLGGLIEGVGSPSPPLLGGLGLVLLGTSLAAAAIPAIRASRIDPVVAFRD